MFVISSTYARPLDQKSPVAEHRAFISEGLRAGTFLAAGARPDGSGGVVIARGHSEQELRTLMRQDPFVRDGIVSEYEFMAFRSSLAVLDELIDS